MDLLDNILEKMEAPLLFATDMDFHRLSQVRNLDTLMISLLQRLKEGIQTVPPSTQREELLRISLILWNGFQGYARLDPPQKQVLLGDAIRYVSEMKALAKGIRNMQEKEVRVTTSEDTGVAHAILLQSIRNARGIGPRIGSLLERKKILTIEDLLYFLPRHYEDRRTICTIPETIPGVRQIVVGRIRTADIRYYGKRKIFEIEIEDGHGSLKAKWFKGREAFLRGTFKTGRRVILAGKVSGFPFDREMLHPDFEIIDENEDQLLNFKRIVPIYSETEGLHQKILRRIVWQAVRDFATAIQSPIPEEICMKRRLIEIREAVRQVHFPATDQNLAPYLEAHSDAHQRLIYDEFFFFQLGMALRKKGQVLEDGISFKIQGPILKKFCELLPFSLTSAQRRVIFEIERDIASIKSMNRLLQGDVGCGKTVVAMTALITVCENGYQTALMAPTEILAEQHYRNLRGWSHPLGLRMELLTAGCKGAERKEILGRIASGDIDIVVGTHALIQEGIVFRSLGLVVIDEQHRFGVVQRASLRKKGMAPDVLVMTATPIPRTLAMTVYGDLDVSIINEMPPGKIPVRTKIFSDRNRERLYQVIRREVEKGHQIFIVYPLVEESENLDLRDATRMAEHLQKEIFADFEVGLIHGRMKRGERERIMADFIGKKIRILVSTTVIEVGIDIPSASLMVIEHAERFGLSQLHQLRGRVGRSDIPSSCILMANTEASGDARKRLKIMEETNDGFRISEEDLAIRGPGEFMGTRQSGLPDFRVADIIRDAHILSDAKTDAFALVERDPGLENPEHLLLKRELLRRWAGRLELVKTG